AGSGLRELKSFAGAAARPSGARGGAGYGSLRELGRPPALSPKTIARLADADAFGSLDLSRRKALWGAKALGRAGDQDDLPLFGGQTMEDGGRRGFSDSPLPSPHTEQLSMAASRPHSAPSPLEGEGWGGGWLFDSEELVPPSRLARSARAPASPPTGEETGASDPSDEVKE